MEHVAFIAASYIVSALGLGLLALWLLMDNGAQKRALAELEARGVRRRSSPANPARLEERTP
ncbi:heme exporter protein CcmD [Xanthobacter sp. KR7-225]|uniref:heme exporter protein CcmD n=1 Tax=Xanthobacter sp. KR7-225 TaxID=3156613 RepID=UPI0032B605E7